jgi:hypothetical protein
MLAIIKPSFYIGQLSVLTEEYMSYVERFLDSEDRDWGGYVKFVIYIREISSKLLDEINKLQDPLNKLIHLLEEIYEGEQSNLNDEYDEDLEPEIIEEPDNLEKVLDESEEIEESEQAENIVNDASREDMVEDYEELNEELRVKLRQADIPMLVEKELAKVIDDMYLECIQLAKELIRLNRMPDGDIITLMSILVDIQYGMCHEMKRYLMEDIFIEDIFSFEPGILTWTARFLANFSDKINQEWHPEE